MPKTETNGVLKKKQTKKVQVHPQFLTEKSKLDSILSVDSTSLGGDNYDNWAFEDDPIDKNIMEPEDFTQENHTKKDGDTKSIDSIHLKMLEADIFNEPGEKVGAGNDDHLEFIKPIELPSPCDPPPPDNEEALSYLFFIRECFMNCSAHGFPRAIESPTQIRKIIWTLFTLCSISVFFYQVSTADKIRFFNFSIKIWFPENCH